MSPEPSISLERRGLEAVAEAGHVLGNTRHHSALDITRTLDDAHYFIHLLSTWRNGLPHKVSRLSILGVLAALFGEVARTMTMLEI
jgi:hypothetical protein